MSTPHLRYPFRFNTAGTADVVEQDSVAEIMQSVQVVLTTTQGDRIEVPQFGVPPLLFASASRGQADMLVRHINACEPRADVVLDITVDNVDQLIQHITAKVALPAGLPSSEISGTPDVVADVGAIGYGVGGYGVQPWGS